MKKEVRSGGVLVTGGLGLVGAALVRRLSRGGPVTVFDSSDADPLEVGGMEGVRIARGSILDAADLKALGPGPWSDVYHLAAQANVPASVADPETDFEINALGTLRLLEWARQVGVRRLLYTSTVAVYRPGSPLPLDENAPVSPTSPYGASKLAGEALALAWERTYGLHTAIVRLFNIYGPGMNKYVIHDLVRKLQKDPETLVILGDGEQTRDYLHVDDAAEAFVTVAEKAEPGAIFNLGSGEPVRIKDLADAIIRSMGLSGTRKEFTGESWPGDIRAWYADSSRLRALGWSPGVSLASGLADTVAWLEKHPIAP